MKTKRLKKYIRALWLFSRIVWRPWEKQRLSVRTSWEVAKIVWLD